MTTGDGAAQITGLLLAWSDGDAEAQVEAPEPQVTL